MFKPNHQAATAKEFCRREASDILQEESIPLGKFNCADWFGPAFRLFAPASLLWINCSVRAVASCFVLP